MEPVTVARGDGSLILGLPHVGTFVPDDIRARMNDEGRLLRDTDWHVDELYAGLTSDATVVRANFHRYVIDANRDPSGQSLYPGQTTTGLIPETTFDNIPIWQFPPDAADVQRRVDQFHLPYHAALKAEIERVRARHGVAIIYDCHSIRSVVPWLFPGTLPDFNIGTDGGRTCDPRVEQAVLAAVQATGRTHVLNGRFRGGWTTRHYGRPAEGLHAIQMELAQSSHLTAEEPPFDLDQEKTAVLRRQLARILADITALAPVLAAERETR